MNFSSTRKGLRDVISMREFSLRHALALVAFGSAVSLFGCDRFDHDEITTICDQEEEARSGGGCFDSDSYFQCYNAYDECGDAVVIEEGCPPQFRCSED